MTAKGTLFLIPVSISETNREEVSGQVRSLLLSLKNLVVEEERSARRFISSLKLARRVSEYKLTVLNEHSDASVLETLISPLLQGEDVGVMSEAGSPCIADPGAGLVRLAHDNEIRVRPLSGPSSIVLALMASGLSGQRFAFHGYLPKEEAQRQRKLASLTAEARRTKYTQLFMETPYHSVRLIKEVILNCPGETILSVAGDLTGDKEIIRSQSVQRWKEEDLKPFEKKPCIFALAPSESPREK